MARSGKNKAVQQEEEVPAAPPRRKSIVLTPICLMYLALAVVYNLVILAGTPDQHNADENAHVLYVVSLVHGHLPVFVAGNNAYENHQPPLYYLLCVPLFLAYKSLGVSGVIHAMRFVGTLLGILLIFVAYKTSQLLFPDKDVLNGSVAAFVAFLPMNINLCASVSNDTLTNLIIALGLWQGVNIVVNAKEKQSRKWIVGQSLIFGVILGAGILTKTSTLLLFPIAIVVYVLAARRGLLEGKLALQGAVNTIALGLLIGWPWLMRNQMLYGDPVAQHIFENAFGNTALADTIIRFVCHGSISDYFAVVAKWTFASYWGVFDSMRLFWGQPPLGNPPSVEAPLNPIYNVILAVAAFSFIGLIRLTIKKPDYITPAVGVALSIFVTLIFLTGFVFLRFILEFFQAQGRYIYPSLVPLTILFWLGLFVWTEKTFVQRIISAAVIIGMLALNVYTIMSLLMPRFGELG